MAAPPEGYGAANSPVKNGRSLFSVVGVVEDHAARAHADWLLAVLRIFRRPREALDGEGVEGDVLIRHVGA